MFNNYGIPIKAFYHESSDLGLEIYCKLEGLDPIYLRTIAESKHNPVLNNRVKPNIIKQTDNNGSHDSLPELVILLLGYFLKKVKKLNVFEK